MKDCEDSMVFLYGLRDNRFFPFLSALVRVSAVHTVA